MYVVKLNKVPQKVKKRLLDTEITWATTPDFEPPCHGSALVDKVLIVRASGGRIRIPLFSFCGDFV